MELPVTLVQAAGVVGQGDWKKVSRGLNPSVWTNASYVDFIAQEKYICNEGTPRSYFVFFYVFCMIFDVLRVWN